MDTKKYVIASVAVFVVLMILDFVVHSLILAGAYEATASVWRPDMESKMWIMWVTGIIFSFMFTLIFAKGQEGKGPMEGARYGLYVGLMVSIPMAYNSYVTLAIPYSLALQWWIYGTIEMIIAGAAAAAVYAGGAKAETA